ncbi:molybdopterin-guanine dinucleotide biosynthesis protein MobB [Aeropyrum pernix]|uniref:Molybdopterin-guanine dinucleotide biosynthesis protein MobB n=1 Tax=Aeropyrum pernix TaxID=56636 RepID=A0A401HAU0_AERPX|nr:molybdopterin-guanine dinucleotide biosynthesis protein MobB [Aeropyrum pernix]
MEVPCIVQIVGPSGSGKTSLIVSVVRQLSERGIKVAVVKHTHHDIDTPGKDSWRFLEEAGASYAAVVKGRGERVAVFTRDTSLHAVLEYLARKVDIIIVEGFKNLRLGGLKIDLSTQRPGRIEESIIEFVEECLKEGVGSEP